MKKNPKVRLSPFNKLKRFVALAGLLTLSAAPLFADTVYVTAAQRPSGTGANTDGQYTEIHANPLSGTSAFSTAVGAPQRSASRFRALSGFTNGAPIVRISPTLGVPGGVYRVHYTHSSTANNSSTAAIVGFTNVVGATLSFSETDAFQRKYGQPAPQPWTFIGYLTNDPGSSTPSFEIFLQSAGADALTLRFLVDCFRFTLDEPCLDTPVVTTTGPLGTNSQQVTVVGVSNATAVTVYQNSGSGMVKIGEKTSGVTVGNNIVTVSGLVKDAVVAATQTVNGQEGCVPPGGTMVGGGANPPVRLAFTLKETLDMGPVGGSATNTSSVNLHFVGATSSSGGSPIGTKVLYPSNEWQTVTLGGQITVSNVVNANGAVVNGTTYSANTPVAIQVYAYQTINETRIYSKAPVQSATVSSNDSFAVNWTWDAVPGATGYRMFRNSSGVGFVESLDVTTNSFADDNTTQWGFETDVTPNSAPRDPYYQWNGATIGSTNGPATTYAILESLNFAVTSDVGPLDIFIDNIQNGSTVFQTFETVTNGTVDYAFRSPTFSGTTSGNILTAPNVSMVTNLTADTGSHSLNLKFQFNGTNVSKWLRYTTSGAGTAANPLVNVADPITVRLLILPVGTVITPPQPPTIGYNLSGDQLTLTWSGSFNLQSKDALTDSWTTIGNSSPYVTTVSGSAKFYRLQAP